jgi:hypothetical protein
LPSVNFHRGDGGSAVLGASIVDQVRDLEGVVAVRDRFTYPGSARSSLRSAPDALRTWSWDIRP